MSQEADHTRRWLINAGGAAILSGAIPATSASAQTVAPTGAVPTAEPAPAVSAATAAFADHVAKALDRELAPEVAAGTKLHVLDTLAAIVSGSRLKPGSLAARYVQSLGGTPQAMVIGTPIVTSSVHAALANAMAAHADETDDTNPVGPVHLGCGAVPVASSLDAAAATSCARWRSATTSGPAWSRRSASARDGDRAAPPF